MKRNKYLIKCAALLLVILLGSYQSLFAQRLIGHWKLDETSGTTAFDASGNGIDIPLRNITDANWVDGVSGGAILLDGTTQDGFLPAPASDVFKLESYSITAYIKHEPTITDVHWGDWIAGHGDNMGLFLQREGGLVSYIHVEGDWNGAEDGDPDAYLTEEWIHVAGTFDAETKLMKFYRNGVVMASGTMSTLPVYTEGDGFSIGNLAADANGRHWAGALDDIRVYDGALSAGEINKISELGSLTAYYDFSEVIDPVVSDVSGNDNDLSLVNADDSDIVWDMSFKNNLSLNGIDQYAQTIDTAVYLTQEFTVAAYVKIDSNYVHGGDHWDSRVFSIGDSYGLGIDRDGNLSWWNATTGGAGWLSVGVPSDSVTGLDDSQWHHIAVAHDTSGLSFFADGKLVYTFTDDENDTIKFGGGYPLSIGLSKPGEDTYVPGNIAEFMFYDIKLNETQIAGLLTNISTDSLIAHYPFDQTSGAAAIDISANMLDLNLVNTDDSNWTSDFDYGPSLTLNGVDQYGETEAIKPFLTQDFTMVGNIMIEPDAIDPGSWGARIGGVPDSYGLTVYNGSLSWWNATNAGDGWFPTEVPTEIGLTLDDGKWHNVAVTHDTTNGLSFYADGILVHTFTNPAENGGDYINYGGETPLRLGVAKLDEPTWFPGTLNDFRIYNNVLSQSDIAGLVKEVDPLFVHYSLDETAGTIAADSKNGMDMTLSNTDDTNWGAGVEEGSITLNGTDQYGKLVDSTLFELQEFTLAAYIKHDDSMDKWGEWIVGYGDNYGLYWNNDDANLQCYIHHASDWQGTVSSGINLLDGLWHHVAGTWESSSKAINLYLDGKMIATDTMDAIIDFSVGHNLYIGNMADENRSWEGSLDEVRVYREALSEAEIMSIVSDKYTLTSSITGNGTVSPASGSKFFNNDVISILATADEGWMFKEWNAFSGTIGGTTNPFAVTVAEDIIAAAVFEESTGIDQDLTEASFRVYPNPFSDMLNIQYELTNEAKIKLTVYDMLGKEVSVLLNQTEHPGTYTLTWDGSEASNGVYYLKIRVDADVKTQKIIINR